MKNLFVSACFLATLFFVACSGGDTKAYDESLGSATSTKPVTPLTITDTLLSDTGSVRPAAQVSMPTSTPSASTTTTLSGNTATAKAGVNPAHGQPGHRCDIAVGASLSTPVTTATPQTTPSTQIKTTPTISSPSALSSGSGKLNPPHGQPGHDCAVEVGKPLKN